MDYTEEEINKYTPMIQAYLQIKKEHVGKLVFYRMGDFYELFFDDAVIASKVLNITLTQRANANGNDIPMAGVPFHAVDTYIQKAVSRGHTVVIVEQFGEVKPGKIVERKVSKIITPGTVLDNGILDDKESKYILSISKQFDRVDLAWINFSSGEIWCNQVSLKDYFNELKNINPSEILVSDKEFNHFKFPEDSVVRSLPSWNFDEITSNATLSNLFGPQYLHQFGIKKSSVVPLIAALINYIKETQCTNDLKHVQSIKWIQKSDFLQIDNNTKTQLELTSSNNRIEQTLWYLLDECSTSMGSRMLKDWLNNPIRDKNTLKSRFERVEYLKSEGKPYLAWKNIAQEWCDIERISTRTAMRSVKPRELAALRNTLRTMPKLDNWASKMPAQLKGFFIHAIPTEGILKTLEKYLQETPAVLVRDGNVIADGIDSILDECRQLQNHHSDFLTKYEEEEKIKTGIPNLKVEYNQAAGFFISVSKSHATKVPDNYIRKQTVKSAERYTTDVLKEYESKSLSANDKALQREKALYDELLNKLTPFISILQKQAKILAEWDILNAFASSADKYAYVAPSFTDEKKLVIKDGRHPVVERNTDQYVPNDVFFTSDNNISIITGPNMGGKSTYMRQIALLIIMAHIGAFVPANGAIIPDIDAIYTRIGANDDIAGGRSTFMVEMTETAFIINNATEKSLVLLDELGRGTATYDGLSLAWSVTEHLSKKINCFALFATHYLEMTDLPNTHPNISNQHVSAIEHGENLVFTHKIEEGAASRSYGLHVAKLAGVTPDVLFIAKNKLIELESNDNKPLKEANREKSSIPAEHLLQSVKELNIMEMTPLQALAFLQEFQSRI